MITHSTCAEGGGEKQSKSYNLSQARPLTLVPLIIVGPYGTIKGTDLRNIRGTPKFVVFFKSLSFFHDKMGTALRNIKTTVKAKRQTLRIIGEPTIIVGSRVRSRHLYSGSMTMCR